MYRVASLGSEGTRQVEPGSSPDPLERTPAHHAPAGSSPVPRQLSHRTSRGPSGGCEPSRRHGACIGRCLDGDGGPATERAASRVATTRGGVLRGTHGGAGCHAARHHRTGSARVRRRATDSEEVDAKIRQAAAALAVLGHPTLGRLSRAVGWEEAGLPLLPRRQTGLVLSPQPIRKQVTYLTRTGGPDDCPSELAPPRPALGER